MRQVAAPGRRYVLLGLVAVLEVAAADPFE
jgi:hypothetical protein